MLASFDSLSSSKLRSKDDELADRGMSRGGCGDGRCGRDGAAPTTRPLDAAEELRSRQAESRGMVWLVGGFLFCPCHLPLTLGLLGAVLAGTAAGALLRDHVVVAAVIITAVWALATWRGMRLLRSGREYAERVR